VTGRVAECAWLERDIEGHVAADAFRSGMASVCTSVAVVTAVHGGQPHGTTVGTFSALSLDPPLILVSLARTSDLLRFVRGSRRFGVNVLSEDQSDLAARFATKGPDKFAGVEAELCDGLPRLRDAGVWLACDVYEFVDGGDHVIVIGGVSWIDSVSFRPLLYHRRSFAALGSSFGSSG